MKHLSLFDPPDQPPIEPLPSKKAIVIAELQTTRERVAAAEADGKELIRFDARPHSNIWIIKRHSNGGWPFWYKYPNEADARAKWNELLACGDYVEG